MRCYSPVTIRQDDGTFISVPCGKCPACLSRKRSEWTFRLLEEQKVSSSSHFVTLTYSDNHLVYGDSFHPSLCLVDLQNFHKRLRKLIKPFKLRYYAVGEYGSKTLRPHYHGIYFNVPDSNFFNKAWSLSGEPIGNTFTGVCNQSSIHYVTKYMIQPNNLPDGLKQPFAVMSRRPGLGSAFLANSSYMRSNRLNYVSFSGGVRLSLPRFYSERIFSKIERQFLGARSRAEFDSKVSSEISRLESLGRNYYHELLQVQKARDYIMHKYSKSLKV